MIFVFQCFFWPICMIWIIFIISIFNSAEQCVLTVPLYFSFINECKYKVAVCVPSFVLRFLYLKKKKKSVVYNLERPRLSFTTWSEVLHLPLIVLYRNSSCCLLFLFLKKKNHSNPMAAEFLINNIKKGVLVFL